MRPKPLGGTTLSDVKNVIFPVIVPIWVETQDNGCLLHGGEQMVNEGRGERGRAGSGPGEKDERRTAAAFRTDPISAEAVQVQV